MGKQKQERRLPANEAQAIATLLRVSPQKLSLVANMIHGMPVEKALVQLQFTRKKSAEFVRKALQSAVANAENNHSLDVDRLVVAEASVGKHFVMKRLQARARGRSARINKPFSRLRVVVREVEDKEAA